MKIQSASLHDIDEIIEVEKETWLDTYPNVKLGITKADIAQRFEDIALRRKELEQSIPESKAGLFLVAKVRNNVIGYSFFLKEPEYNDLVELYILPLFQNQGIGSRLMRRAADWFDSSKDIILEVVSYNR